MWNDDWDICFHCGKKGHWKNCPKKQRPYKADGTEAGMEERKEPVTSNRERDREEHITHLEGECTTPTQTLITYYRSKRFFRKERRTKRLHSL